MSGGVDSSVAALVLKEQGFDVVGASMHLFSCDRPHAKSCCSARDRMDARRVCEMIGVPFLSLDHRRDFKRLVIEPFVAEYLKGRTPSPCILCNQHLKFGVLFDEAGRIGASHVATGHYAQVVARGDGSFGLHRGHDVAKDQSYFLFTLTQKELGKVLFPVGKMAKTEVRRIAKEKGLPTSEKTESQEICFVADGDYASFVEEAGPCGSKGAGDFVDTEGKKIGRHKGIHCYTVGQRRGLGFGVGRRQYVVGIDAERNEVVLGTNGDLLKKEISVRAVSFTGSTEGLSPADGVEVQIRSTHRAAPARIEDGGDGTVKVVFEEAQRAIAPGQAAVFYRGSEVIGGGLIA